MLPYSKDFRKFHKGGFWKNRPICGYVSGLFAPSAPISCKGVSPNHAIRSLPRNGKEILPPVRHENHRPHGTTSQLLLGTLPPELVESPSGICEAPTIRPVRLSLPYLWTAVYCLWQPTPHLLQPCLLPARPLPQTERNVNHANTNLTLGNPPTGYPIGCECDCIGCFGIFFALDSVLFDSFFRIRPVFLGNPPFCKQQPAPILTHFPGAIAFVPDSLPCPLPLITLAKS